MTKRSTIKDVAELSGYSITTVSFVINNNAKNIPDAAKEKIYQAIKELNYHPNLSARSLVSGNSKIIGVLIPDISNDFFSSLVHDLQKEFSKYGYDIILCNSDEQIENDLKSITLFSNRGVDGMILALSAESMKKENENRIKQTLNNSFVPYIFIDRYFDDDSYKVFIDNEQSGYNVSKTLYELGHKRIGFITGPSSLNSSVNRFMGAIKFLKEQNIEVENNLIYEGKYDYETGYNGCKELIKNNITAIFAFNDLQAYGVMMYCKEHNINIPDDLCLIGFDNLETSQMMSPRLSSVMQPISELSKQTVEMLIKIINKENPDKEIKLSTKLIIRESLRRIS